MFDSVRSTVRRFTLPVAMLSAVLVLPGVQAQQIPAIPASIKAILKTPPKRGALLRISGYLVTVEKEPQLQDVDSGRRLALDFAASVVKADEVNLRGASKAPIMVIGRMLGTKGNGQPIIGVLDVIELTP